MPNTAHILETSVLILVAFLVGCVVGYFARRLIQRSRVSQPATTATTAEAPVSGPPLVTAPAIAPLPGTRRRSAAERLAAAAGRSPIDEPPTSTSTVPEPAIAPSAPLPDAAAAAPTAESVIIRPPPAPPATEVSPGPVVADGAQPESAAAAPEPVIILPPPSAPAVEIPPASTPADELPVDTAASVATAQPQAEPAVAGAAALHLENPRSPEPMQPSTAPASEPVAAPVTRTALEDPEAAAMRAIEGNWTPRRRAPQNPVPHPDQTPAPREVDDAMQTARSAVAAAAAAAAAAIAEAQERPQRLPSDEGLSFEQRSEAMAKSFLEGDDAMSTDPAVGLSFEPEHPVEHQSFGRPQALPEPREGSPDNLKQIKGITPALEASLHGLGIFHFDQIAAWDQKAIVWVEQHLSLHGRIGRDKWLEQAREFGTGRGQTLRPVRR